MPPGEPPVQAANPSGSGFIAEMSRRRVLRFAGLYVAGAWLGTEILTFLFDQFHAPAWTYRVLAILFVTGFPVTVTLAWVFQVREDGRWAVDPSAGQRRTAALAMILALLVTAGLAWLLAPGDSPQTAYKPLPNSVAVLPFTQAALTPNERTASDTLYRALMARLERAGTLTLVRLGPGPAPEDPVEFGRTVGAGALVSGQLVQTPSGTQLQVSMIEVANGSQLWSQSYSWDPTRIAETGAAIANGVFESMGLPALADLQGLGTENKEALEAFLAAQRLAGAWTAQSLEQAIVSFQRAVVLDPGYLQAHVGLAGAIFDLLALQGVSEPRRLELERQATRSVEIAQRLDQDSADVISLLGLVTGNRQLRIQAFERALELDPDHDASYFRYAVQMRKDGDLEEAERLLTHAVALRPMSPKYRMELADLFRLQGRESEARAEQDKALAFQYRQEPN